MFISRKYISFPKGRGLVKAYFIVLIHAISYKCYSNMTTVFFSMCSIEDKFCICKETWSLLIQPLLT